MGFWDINISQFVSDILPRSKRTDEVKSLGRGLLSAFGRRAVGLQEFKEGTAASVYAAGTYAKYDQVVYNYALYESLEDGNTADPSDSSKWLKIADAFLGSDEMQLYDGTRIGLEYALNRWFGTTFNNPPTLSDIYITNNVPDYTFIVGVDEPDCNNVGIDSSDGVVPLTYSYSAAVPLFTINVPAAFYAGLGADAEQIIRNFADNYVNTSITYDIQTY